MTTTQTDAAPALPTIGVVGPGLMGLGICHAAALAGLRAVLVGRSEEAARGGLERWRSELTQRVARGRLDAVAATQLHALATAADDDSALAGCALVVEAVSEDREVKQAVLRRIEAAVARGAVIATNTSGLPVSGLAASLAHPDRFIGLHFFSPVDRMPLVEVVVGRETSAATTEAALAWVRRLGKQPVVVRDSPGFFTSRVFAAYLDEAAAMVGEGVAPERIEAAAAAAGMPLGPLAMLDETGLALNWQQARQARADGLSERFCRPLAWPVLDRMVSELGRRGRRDGGGFYDYPGAQFKNLWPGLAQAFALRADQPEPEHVQHRLMHAQALAAAACLEEGIVASAQDADLASVLGLGFPKAQGGVLAQVERQGLARFVAECDALADRCGERFRPSTWLRERHALR
ncbi:3-hydroxyacyl-CoA dehydrogenase [Variovorax sp. OK605]|uniref:3-hydroxyacyl-CoA dehydrogenase family protein n=1 Tax=Variovorax sp. OK605 TaxID=1855317 RepID=UPI0008E52709|nr:3-hydroxyacyl-CoA dehydrogenase family protein [Variovorax sp. OK605]SFP56110.1 3-hydroxyacyl-CoA dehydrogenase [Variovorax sp. OK605]